MPKITAIETQKRNSNRVNVFVDGEFAIGLRRSIAAGLQVGQTLHCAEMRELERREEQERGYESALGYLSYRPRSEYEMRRYLLKKDLQETAIEEIMTRLKQAGLIDDREFAELWVEDRCRNRPRGPWALRSELREKGVSDIIIEDALKDLDERSIALKAARRAARKYARIDDQETFRRRFFGYLKRRGFDYGICWEMTDRFWQQLQSR